MNDTIAETEEQAEARIRSLRAQVALEEAPDAVSHLRELLEPGDGRTERGEVLPYLRTPLLTKVADDADRTYELLAWWVDRWTKALGVPPLAVTFEIYRSKVHGLAKGFPSTVTPELARSIVRMHTAWLLRHHDEIDRHADGDWFNDEIAAQVWQVRSGHGLTKPRPVARALPRRCPFGHDEVQALFFGEPLFAAEQRGEFDFELATADDRRNPSTAAGRQILDAVDGVRVKCGYCEWQARPKVSEIAEWLS